MRSHSGASDARVFRARLGDAFKTIEGADGPKHMRGVGALPAPGAARVWEYTGCDDGRVVADGPPENWCLVSNSTTTVGPR